MSTTIFPYSRMDFGQAMYWMAQGYKLRRAIWRLTSALPFQVAAAGDTDLRWFYSAPENEKPGVYLYNDSNFSGKIITNVLLTAADMASLDWTCDAVDSGVDSYAPTTTNPNSGKAGVVIDDGSGTSGTDGSGTSGGSSDGSGSGDGGSGGSGSGGDGSSVGSPAGGTSGGGFSGVGGGGGGGGGGGAIKKKTPPTFNPSIFFNAWSLAGPPAEYPISGSGSSAAIITTSPQTENFAGNIYLSSNPGDLFFVTITCGIQIVYHGTLGSGQSKDFTFSITALPAETLWPYTDEGGDPFYRIDGYTVIPGSGVYAVTATAYIPNRPGTTITRSVNVSLRGHAQQCPGGIYSRTGMFCGSQA